MGLAGMEQLSLGVRDRSLRAARGWDGAAQLWCTGPQPAGLPALRAAEQGPSMGILPCGAGVALQHGGMNVPPVSGQLDEQFLGLECHSPVGAMGAPLVLKQLLRQ